MKSRNGVEKETTISGIVSPTGWDDEGRVQTVCVATDQGKYYFLSTEKKELNLVSFLKKYVEVSGIVSTYGNLTYLCISQIREVVDPNILGNG